MPPRTLAALAVLAVLVPAAPAAHAAPQVMSPLATVSLPGSTDTIGSATVAFDGRVLYYMTGNSTAGGPTPGRVERAVLTGAGTTMAAVALPPITLPAPVFRIAYDARHRALVTETYDSTRLTTTVGRYDLRTGRTTRLFALADDLGAGAAYDWSSDHYVTADGSGLRTYDGSGRKVASCTWKADAAALVGEPSELIGSGDGEVYEQAEDDSTIYRVSRDCRTPGTFEHRTTAEATSEDDSMACDAVTFGTPVVWIRDTATTTVSAYALPSGACVLPTVLSATATATRLCATLRRAEVAVPVAGVPLALSVDAGAATAVTTGANGTACVPVTARPGRHVAVATYAGSRAWARAAARRPFAVAALAAAVRPRTAAARTTRPAREILDAPGTVLPHTGPVGKPPAHTTSVSNTAAQQAYGNATVVQALPGAVPVPEPEAEPQLAYAMSDLGADRRRSSLPAAMLLAAAVVSAVAAGVAARRATSAQPARARF
jgi:hypothetical protein